MRSGKESRLMLRRRGRTYRISGIAVADCVARSRVVVSSMLFEELLGNFEPAEGFEAVYWQLRLFDLHTHTQWNVRLLLRLGNLSAQVRTVAVFTLRVS